MGYIFICHVLIFFIYSCWMCFLIESRVIFKLNVKKSAWQIKNNYSVNMLNFKDWSVYFIWEMGSPHARVNIFTSVISSSIYLLFIESRNISFLVLTNCIVYLACTAVCCLQLTPTSKRVYRRIQRYQQRRSSSAAWASLCHKHLYLYLPARPLIPVGWRSTNWSIQHGIWIEETIAIEQNSHMSV